MRFILGLMLLVGLFSSHSQSQTSDQKDIIGIWQFGTKEVSAGFFDSYQFFANGTFKFNTNQYDGTRRILSIGGTYEVKNNRLRLKTSYSIEIQGGFLVRSETAGGSGWEISGGKIVTLNYKTPQESFLSFGICENEKECILLDSLKYYLVDKDPKNYN